jgi:DNA-binding beta-propeller fold protein YncE
VKAALVRSVLLIALCALGVAAPGAAAKDRIYWTSFDTGRVNWANLDGSGGVQELNVTGATIAPEGYGFGGDIDPVQQRFYWANQIDGTINWANLDGSGGGHLNTGTASVSEPDGISVDSVGRLVYWANGNDTIGYANLDGSGGGDLTTGMGTVDNPHGTTAFPAAGRVYWGNWGLIATYFLSFARTDGSGGQTLSLTGTATMNTPFGIAIDAAAQRIYWANDNPGIVSVANLDGSNASDIDNRGLKMEGPYGVALDPEAGRAYTANFAGNNLTYIGVDGSGGATVPVALPKESGPNFPVLLKDPRPTSAPAVTRKGPPTPKSKKGRRKPAPLPKLVGSSLTCQSGGWAPDLVEARLYRSPSSIGFSWTRDGAEVAGAHGNVIIADRPGNYRCRVTGANAAGSTTQTTGAVAIFKAGKLKRDVAKGTAKLTVELPAEKGALKLSAKGFKAVSRQASGKVAVLVKPKGAKKAKLAAKGGLKAVVKLTYSPPDGPPATLRTRITLKQG